MFAPLTFNTELFLSLDNEDKMYSKRRVIYLVPLFFLLSSTSKSFLIKNFFVSFLGEGGMVLLGDSVPLYDNPCN